jgi:hypothetical protein
VPTPSTGQDGSVRWEYKMLSRTSVNEIALLHDINAAGLEDWEVAGFAAPDKTVGFNGLVVILKRPLAGPELEKPKSDGAGWYDDPSGRHEKRYWDGLRWTSHVADQGEQASDPPVVSPS